MNKLYIYYGENKDFKKLCNLSSSINGLSYLGAPVKFCALKLSEKLERRLKLFTFEVKRPKKITYLYKIISKCKIIYSDMEYVLLCQNAYTNMDNVHHSDKSYKKMPKGITKDNQEDYKKGSGDQRGIGKSFCTECHFTHKSYRYPMFIGKGVKKRFLKDEDHCPNCGAQNSHIWLNSSVRVPKKDASKKVWKNFYKLFINNRKR